MAISTKHQENPHSFLKLVAIFIVFLSPELVFAGAHANVYACIYLNQVETPLNFEFTSKRLQCMKSTGNSPVTLKVTQGGVTCAPLGRIEQKSNDTGGDNCYGLNSGRWMLAASGGDGNYSGTVQTELYYYFAGSNHMRLLDDSSPNINICYAPDKCTDKQIKWDKGTGEVYLIFQPAANNGSKANKAISK